MFNINLAKFIPQANVQKKQPELEDLVQIKVSKKIEWDLYFNPEQNRWKIKSSFLTKDGETGYTAALQDGYLFLIQANDSQVEELKPKFLKGISDSFTSNYFNLLAVQAGFSITEKCYLFLTEQETGIENVKAYLVTKEIPDVVLPEKEETLIIEAPITTSSVVVEEKIWEGTPDNTNLF